MSLAFERKGCKEPLLASAPLEVSAHAPQCVGCGLSEMAGGRGGGRAGGNMLGLPCLPEA